MSEIRKGMLLVISGPSGTGKGTLIEKLMKEDPTLVFSVSATTRAPRPGEENGREYHFVSVEDFEARKANDEFLEWALVHGNYYGTSRVWIEEQMRAGNDVLLEIDWQGARQVRQQFPDVLGVFILPPSLQILAERLNKRGTDSQEVIAKRLKGAGAEIEHATDFEFVIINDDFETALNELNAVVTAARLTCKTQAVRHRQQFIDLGVPV
jgi:guanylate kinase